MVHLITGYSGSAHITSANDGAFNAHVFGESQYGLSGKNKLAIAINGRTITINTGDGLINGRFFEVTEAETYNIDTVSSGKSRIDYVVMRYEKAVDTAIESMDIYIIKGTEATTPVAPSYNEGNILNGDAIVDMPLYKLTVTSSGITSTKLFSTLEVSLTSLVGATGFTGTQAEVEAAILSGIITDGTIVNITDDYDAASMAARAVSYDNTESILSDTEVQGALDSISGAMAFPFSPDAAIAQKVAATWVSDPQMMVTAKNLQTQINEINTKIEDLVVTKLAEITNQ